MRKLEGNEGSSCLKVGVMLARSQAAGNTPSVRDKLNNLQRMEAISLAVSFNIRPGMLSGPQALLGSRFSRA